jgi:hypothetical protein
MAKRPTDDFCKIDYADKLTSEQRRWLKSFNDTFHRGYSDDTHTDAANTASERAAYVCRNDVWTQCARVSRPEGASDDWYDAAKQLTVSELDCIAPRGKERPAKIVPRPKIKLDQIA